MKKFAQISFLAISAVTILEYLFIFGMFTGPLVMALTCLVGIINIVLSIKDKQYNAAALYLIATVALSMAYWKVMF